MRRGTWRRIPPEVVTPRACVPGLPRQRKVASPEGQGPTRHALPCGLWTRRNIHVARLRPNLQVHSVAEDFSNKGFTIAILTSAQLAL